MSSCESNCQKSKKKDWFFLGSTTAIIICFIAYFLNLNPLHDFAHSVVILMNQMWIGILLGIFFVGILNFIPRELVISALGPTGKTSSLLRATLAGLLLDLCNHGILMVGAKLYERGASLGQVMAFLIASPWNSFSLTFILWSLIGFKWTLLFIALSAVIAIVSGWIFERLVERKVLPSNPNTKTIDPEFRFWRESKNLIRQANITPHSILEVLTQGLKGSKMILKWIFFGTLLAAAVQNWVDAETLQTYFGPTLLGIGLTLIFATIIEVCSEGATPLAADLLTRAQAPGNSFAFLMTGVSTDYTEILVIRETTKSWKIALFLPLVSIPQIVVISLILNGTVNL